jgi:DnaJ-class molecular chaperone
MKLIPREVAEAWEHETEKVQSRRKRKCSACHGTGHVMKYVQPNVIGLVSCLVCRGTGKAA